MSQPHDSYEYPSPQPQGNVPQAYAQGGAFPQQPGPYAAYYAAPQPTGKSTASLVIGLLSLLFGWTLVAPVVGFFLGIAGLRSEPAGRGMSIAGLILNGLCLLGWALVILFFVFVIGAFGVAATQTGGTPV